MGFSPYKMGVRIGEECEKDKREEGQKGKMAER